MVAKAVKVSKKDQLKEAYTIGENFTCEKCRLGKCHNKYVLPVGNIEGQVLFVGDMPEVDDERTGAAFTGPRGMLLKKTLDEIGFNTKDIYLTNVIMCLPPDRAPLGEEISACKEYINQIIAKMPNLKYVVPLGAIAMQTLTKYRDMLNRRGTIIEIKGIKYIPTYSPNSILKDEAIKNLFVQDLTLVKNLLAGSISYGKYKLVDTLELFHTVIDAVEANEVIAVDIETSKYNDEDDFSNFLTDEILGISLSWREFTGVYIPFVDEGKQVWSEEIKRHIVDKLSEALTKPDKKLVLHNGKFDARFLDKIGINLFKYNTVDGARIHNYFFDTFLAATLLEDDDAAKSLDALVKDYPDLVSYDNELENFKLAYAKQNKMKKRKLQDYSKIPMSIMYRYAATDADATIRLFHKYYPEITRKGFDELYYTLVLPFAMTMTKAEIRGITIDLERVEEMKIEYERKLVDTEAEFKSIAGVEAEFNIGSPKQLGELFYEKLKLTPVFKTEKEAYCVDEKALDALKSKHPAVQKLLEYRTLDKTYTTYILAYIRVRDKHDAIHTTFNTAGTVTGRTCVSGDTILDTTTGRFEISQIELTEDSKCAILTHTGQKKNIIRKIYKGKEEMFEVTLDNGKSIKCTKAHRFLTPEGWRSLNELTTRSKVYTYEDVSKGTDISGKKTDTGRKKFLSHFYSGGNEFNSGKENISYFIQYGMCLSKILVKKIFGRIKKSKVQELLESLEREHSWKTRAVQNNRETSARETNIDRIFSYTNSEGAACERVFDKKEYRISSDKEIWRTSKTNAGYRFGISKKIRNFYSRFNYLGKELLSESNRILREIIRSIFKFSSTDLVYSGSGKGSPVFSREEQNTKKPYSLGFQSIRNATVNMFNRFENRTYSTVDDFTGNACRFLFPTMESDSGTGRRISLDRKTRDSRQEKGEGSITSRNTYSKISSGTGVEKSRISCFSNKTARIKKITGIGLQDVWDIEVEGDHSYCAHGFINHNSSSGPNTQNIPKGSTMRKLFISRPGYSFVITDFSQIELRVEAALSRDPMLLEYFWSGKDVHTAVACEIFNTQDPTKAQRDIAKTINFGLIYGRGPRSVAEELGITIDEAKAYIEAYFERFKGVVAFNDKTISEAKRLGYVSTIFGRKRPLPEIYSDDKKIRSGAERQAKNTPVQGGAADCTNLSAVKLGYYFDEKGYDAHLVHHVHDELIYEVRNDQIPQAMEAIYNIMRHTAETALKVPVLVDQLVNVEWYEPDPKRDPEGHKSVKLFAEALGVTDQFIKDMEARYISPLQKPAVGYVKKA